LPALNQAGWLVLILGLAVLGLLMVLSILI